MIYFIDKSEIVTLAADAEHTVKDFGETVSNLVIINNTDNALEVNIYKDTTDEVIGKIQLSNGMLDFENKVPKNKVVIKNIGTTDSDISIMFGE